MLSCLRSLLATVAALLVLTPAVALSQGGPDASGQFWSATTYDFVVLDPAAGGLGTPVGTVTGSSWEFDVALPWGAGFPFYGNTYTDITVSEEGGIVMGAGEDLYETNGSLPDTSLNSPDIAVFWDGLDGYNYSTSTPNGGAWTYYDATADRFIVSWEGVADNSDAGAGSFQVHLFPDGSISMHYADTTFGTSSDNGGSATIGIQDFTGGTAGSGNALEVSYNTAVIVDGVTAYSFVQCVDVDVDGFYDAACGGADCDDALAAINPNAVETCNDTIDQDCSGADSVDDFDADGGINIDCGGTDCDDLDATVNAAATEVCADSIDNDCNAATVDLFDNDLDTYDCTVDCDDSVAATNPAAVEVCSDGIDNDCDGIPLNSDTDLDGEIAIACGGTDCDDFDAALNNTTDADGDGSVSCDDCDDNDATALPGGTEVCDGADNDCDGTPASGGIYAGGSNGFSFSGSSYAQGRGGIWDITTDVSISGIAANLDLPAAEPVTFAIFDGGATGGGTYTLAWSGVYTTPANATGRMDHLMPATYALTAGNSYIFAYFYANADYGYSSPSEMPVVTPWGSQVRGFATSDDLPGASYTTSGSSTHYGLSVQFGTDELADLDGDGVTGCLGDCDDNNAAVLPTGTEVCDGADNDCDGNTDDVDGDADGEIALACGGTDCDDTDATVGTTATEVCDLVDSDCDGLPDEMDTSIGTVMDPPSSGTSAPGTYFDNTADITDTITITGATNPILDVNVTVNVTHTYTGDVTMSLTSPTGTTVVLTDQNGGSANDFINTVFDDSASTYIGNGSAPFTGSFQPEDALSSLAGEVADGVWTLTLADAYGGDNGNLVDWTLDIVSGVSSDVDGDGFVADAFLCAAVPGDCDDTDATIYLGALEVCGDTIDQDCDGLDLASDVDQDGFDDVACGGTDCDDNNVLVFDGSDNDGDLALGCQDDCDDTNAAVGPTATEICSDAIDNDCDGVALEGLDVDADGETDCTDCDDTDATVNSAATEVCADGIDNNCSGTADDLDADGDGGVSFDCGGSDCDDADATAYLGAAEVCDAGGADNDCDGVADIQDLDIGSTGTTTSVSDSPAAYLDNVTPVTATVTVATGSSDPIIDVNVLIDVNHTYTGDIVLTVTSPTGTTVEMTSNNGGGGNDFIGTVFDDSATTSVTSGSAPFTGSFIPEEPLSAFNGELPDGVWTFDFTDSYGGDSGTVNTIGLDIFAGVSSDTDGDGYIAATFCAGGDCDEADAAINPGAVDICGDTIDQDCSGADADGDVDLDTYVAVSCGGDDCDDADATVFPGAAEVCNDTIDNDCDAATVDLFDDDGDSFDCSLDCDDTNALAYPGFPFDICNDGADNDCDASTLDLADLDGDGVPCDTDCDDTNPIISPSQPELLCSGTDEDCDQGVLTPDVDDGDGDGFDCDVDCTDTDPAINPAALEIACDALDNDCDVATDGEVDVDLDGVTCGLDCDDNQPAAFPGNVEVCNDAINNDCDAATVDDFDNDADGVTCVTDCDDADPLVNPFAPEICGDGIDQDCDSAVDESVNDSYGLTDDDAVLIGLCGFDFPFCGSTWDEVYVQSNGRLTFGFSSTEHTESAASFLAEAPEIAAFWNDLNPAAGGTISIEEVADTGTGASLVVTWTDVPELGVAGSANSATLTLWDDGTANLAFGALSMTDGLVGFSCGGTGAVVVTDLSDYTILPNAWAVGTGTESALYELFNDQGNTNDLDNTVIDLCLTGGDDADSDGWTDVCGDCDDTAASSFPGAAEVCGDGLDNDCNGVADDADLDLDGEIDAACGGADCNDADDAINTSAVESCNGIDDDCDGAPETGGEDADADGYLVCDGDCDDGDAAINPDGVEVCDQIDNDCDGVEDNGFAQDADNDGVISDDCAGDDCDDTNDAVYPGADEICDLADNDCNGETDEIDFDADTYIDANCGGDDCDDTNPDVNPGGTEIAYDGLDNDCLDGDLVDNDGDGYFGGEDGGDCDDSNPAINPGAVEGDEDEATCEDGIDNNCDGGVDYFDKDADIPADVKCNTGCGDCSSSLVDTDGAPGALMLLLGLAGLMGVRRRRVL